MERSSHILEHPSCPLCGGTESRPVLEAGENWICDGYAGDLRFSVVRCAHCRACFTSPRFPEPLKHLAFSGSYPFYERARRACHPPGSSAMIAFNPRIQQILRAHPAPGSILDIGMGDGAFLAAMQQHGWDVYGIDIEPSVVAYAHACLGIEYCKVADVENDPLPVGSFDCITLWGMLQLTYRPGELLAKLRTIISPEGILAIGLSNFNSAGARIFRSHWYGLGLPRHLIHFDPASLKILLDQSGFEIIEVSFDTPDWIVNGSVNTALPMPRPMNKAVRYIARRVLGCLGHRRWGDTFSVLARPTELSCRGDSCTTGVSKVPV